MREIKFRAMRNGCWYYLDLTNTTGFARELLEKMVGGEVDFSFDTPLIEYTGLREKNGVEIYEGDIVRLGDGSRDRVVVYNHLQAGFMLRWDIFATDTNDFMHADYFSELHPDRVSKEVIGNIYEHSYLLDTKTEK